MSSLTNKNQRGGGQFSFILLLLVLLAGSWAAVHHQGLTDWWKLQQYSPSFTISALAAQDTMTGYSRNIFYLNRPSVEDKSRFSQDCPNNGGEQTIILGCYRDGESGIFLLKVNDSRLDGVLQVTAAHEMLHGAYERLSDTERRRVDAMLMNYYRNDLHDAQIKKTIDAYKKSEPDAIVNEMHSIFATEVAQLPENLETYYRQYFTDRAAVVGFASKYRTEFTSREAAISNYDDQLAGLKLQINNAEDDLRNKQNTIQAQENILIDKRNSGDITGYNAGVPVYNNLVDAYNEEVVYVRNLVSRYNQLVNTRNTVAFEENELYKELSGVPTPIQR